MVVLEQKDSRIDQCQLSGGIEVSLLDGGGRGKRGENTGASGSEKSYHRVVRVECGGFKS